MTDDYDDEYLFQSTLSMRRATCLLRECPNRSPYFNPRSP